MRLWQIRKLLLMILVANAASGCNISSRNASRLRAESADGDYEKLAWIEKASRALSCGQTSASTDEIQALSALPREKIVDELMRGARFEATMVDFAKFFTNASGTATDCTPDVSSLTAPESISSVIENYYSRPNLLFAAKATVESSDFFSLFDLAPGKLVAPIRPKTSDVDPDKQRDALLARVDAALVAFGSESAPNDVAGCKSVWGVTAAPVDAGSGDFAYNSLSDVASSKLNETGLGSLTRGLGSDWFEKILKPCEGAALSAPSPPPPNAADHKEIIAQLNAVRPKIVAAFKVAKDYNIATYRPGSLAELKYYDVGQLMTDPSSNENGGQFPYLDFSALQNSSTNYDRKRGAYILKTFFCDDLTPVSVVAPESHAQGAHATDPNCQACHYKLDPMAGFFREIGGGSDFFGQAGDNQLIFSDGKVIQGEELAKYRDTWRAPANSGHEWNVGYIRSTTKTASNFYGSDLKDLFSFMKTAPEVRACLVRRLAEYFIGKNQAYDGGWLASLGDELSTAPGKGADNVRGVVRELLLSKSFSAPDPTPDECYDHKMGEAASALPCTIAWTLRTACEKCHKGESALGGLDLSTWKALPGGGTGFPHVDDDGQPVARIETLKRIKERLDTTDKNKRMPQNQDMPDSERARLYKWVSGMLEASGGAAP